MPALKLKDKDGNWIPLPTIKGDKGDPGAAGATGPQGTPTTVNGKSGSSITLTAADVGALPVSGGTMTGSLNMGGKNIMGAGSIFPEGGQGISIYTDRAINMEGPVSLHGNQIQDIGSIIATDGAGAIEGSWIVRGVLDVAADEVALEYAHPKVRNIALVTSTPTSLSNGAVALVYE